MNRDQHRRFSKRQRRIIYLAADGCSEISGQPLDDDWQVDHVVPWSKGGATNLGNAQATTRRENLRKKDSMQKSIDVKSVLTRSWQVKFLEEWEARAEKDFLLAALPASGKTRASLGCAYQFLRVNQRRRLIVVVPTLNVRDQWHHSGLEHFGIQLLTHTFQAHLNDPAFNGAVVTYQSVASNPLLFQRLCNKHEVMAILDEVHHGSTVSNWGKTLQTGFEPALRRLSLTGTPFRSDQEKIPFLTLTQDGEYVCDYSYDYPSALEDGVIRDICFHRFSGRVDIREGKEVKNWHTSDVLGEDDAARRLRSLLWAKEYAMAFLKAAHHQLLECRRTMPDAGGLVVCIDANHAVKVASWLREITGMDPDLIISDEERSTSCVNDFRNDLNRKWIVSVRQVSEGVDVNRLMVLAYMTNWRSRMFFRQAVGRIMRSRGTDMDVEAYCFLPVDPELDKCALEIEKFQAEIKEKQERNGGGDGGGARREMAILGSTAAELEGLVNRGTDYERELAQEVIRQARKYSIPEGTMGRILLDMDFHPRVSASDNEKDLAALRRRCNTMAVRLAFKLGKEPRDIHEEWIKKSNVGHGQMTLAQFQEKEQWLQQKLAKLR